MDEVKDTGEETQYLIFHLGGHEYAVALLQIREIIEYETVATMPGTPPSIRGVISLRGSAVPIVDLAVTFGLPDTQIKRETCILILELDLEGQRTLVGIVADDVGHILGLSAKDVEAPPPLGTPVRADYLEGLAKVEGKLIPILDVHRVLTSREFREAASLEAAPVRGDGTPGNHDEEAPEGGGPIP